MKSLEFDNGKCRDWAVHRLKANTKSRFVRVLPQNNEHISQASSGVFVPAGCVFHSYVSLCGDSDPVDQRCNTRGRQRRHRILHWFPVQSDKSLGCAGT